MAVWEDRVVSRGSNRVVASDLGQYGCRALAESATLLPLLLLFLPGLVPPKWADPARLHDPFDAILPPCRLKSPDYSKERNAD